MRNYNEQTNAMKFVVDENLPVVIAEMLRDAGHMAYHVNELKTGKKQRVTDDQLRKLSIYKDYIMITRDDDFVRSYVSRKVPEKLIFIYHSGHREELIQLFDRHFNLILETITRSDFIELKESGMRTPFD